MNKITFLNFKDKPKQNKVCTTSRAKVKMLEKRIEEIYHKVYFDIPSSEPELDLKTVAKELLELVRQ